MTCLKEALKYCIHQVEISFINQITRLSQAGFQLHLVSRVCDKLLKRSNR